MSVWILQSPFSAEEEKHLAGHTELPLPYDNLPDLNGVKSEKDMQRLLALVHPAAPPETIFRQADVHWNRYGQLMEGDLIVLPLSNGKIALAEITVRYRYRVEAGRDVHVAEIKWLDTAIPKRKLTALMPLFKNGLPLQPVENVDDRKKVYALLKRSYNRFARFRWILGLLILLQSIAIVLRMLKPS